MGANKDELEGLSFRGGWCASDTLPAFVPQGISTTGRVKAPDA